MSFNPDRPGPPGPPPYPPPGAPYPPPRKGGAGKAIALFAGAVVLLGGGAVAAKTLLSRGGGPSDAPSRGSSAVASPGASPSSGGMVIETLTLPPDMPDSEAGQLYEGQIRYLDEIRKNAVPVRDSKAALRDAETVCDVIGSQGFRAATEAVNRQDPTLGVEDIMFVTTSALYHLCPSDTPFGASVPAPQPPSTDPDEAFLARAATTGLQLDDFPNAVDTARQVCTQTRQGKSLLDVSNYVSSVSPESSDEPDVAFAVTAIISLCPRA